MEKKNGHPRDGTNLCGEDCSKERCAWYVPESVGADDGEPIPGHCSTVLGVNVVMRG